MLELKPSASFLSTAKATTINSKVVLQDQEKEKESKNQSGKSQSNAIQVEEENNGIFLIIFL